MTLVGGVRASQVFVRVYRAAGVVGEVFDVLAVWLPAFMPGGREGLDNGGALGIIQLCEQLGPTLVDVKFSTVSSGPFCPSCAAAAARLGTIALWTRIVEI